MSLRKVALYPLSSPNHNKMNAYDYKAFVALYPLSSPNHNGLEIAASFCVLRYILFHHQTTTGTSLKPSATCCVISSFITKPQQHNTEPLSFWVALYPLSSPNHNIHCSTCCVRPVALYPLSSPNHNPGFIRLISAPLRYILFHHQTTTKALSICVQSMLRYILFHHQTTTNVTVCFFHSVLRYILFHHQTTTGDTR